MSLVVLNPTVLGALTVADLVEETLDHLSTSATNRLNFLGATLDTDDTTLTFTDPVAFAVGNLLGISGTEVVYVRSVNKSDQTAIVRRAVRGTEAQVHAANAIVDVGARFMRSSIRRALRAEIASWRSSVFRVRSASVPMGAGAKAVDVPGLVGDYYHLLKVEADRAWSSSGSWPELDATVMDPAPASAFASGRALVLSLPAPDATTVFVTWSAPFDVSVFTDTTLVEATVGLSFSMCDIPALGAAWRLLTAREAARSATEAQGEPRLAEEVPPGSASSAGMVFKKLRDGRLGEEALRLRERYPFRTSGV